MSARSMDAMAGQVLDGRFRIEGPLGKGGMGRLYVATDLERGDACVVKELDIARIDDLKALELFEREVAVLKSLNHPQIPALRAHFTVEGEGQVRLFFAQDRVPGKNLESAFQEGQRFNTAEILRMAREVIDVLMYLHRQRPPIIHRDIKPANLILRPDGHVAVVDFGAVRHTTENAATGGSTVVGTFGYMAPEQLRGHAEPASDVYALGASMLFLFTGRDPSDFEQNALKLDLRRDSGLGEPVIELLEVMLEPAVEIRRKMMPQLLRGFERVARGSLPFLPDDGPVSAQARERSTVEGRNRELPQQVKDVLNPAIVQAADDIRDVDITIARSKAKLEEIEKNISWIDRINFLHDTADERRAKAVKKEIADLQGKRHALEKQLIGMIEERALSNPLFAMRADFEAVRGALRRVSTRTGEHRHRPSCPVHNLDDVFKRLDRVDSLFRTFTDVKSNFKDISDRIHRGAVHGDRRVLDGLGALEQGIVERAVGHLRQRGYAEHVALVERLEDQHAAANAEHKQQKQKVGFFDWLNFFTETPEEVRLKALAGQLGGVWRELSDARRAMQELLQSVLDAEALLRALSAIARARAAAAAITARPVERTRTRTRHRPDGSTKIETEEYWECELFGVSTATSALAEAENTIWDVLGRPMSLDELKVAVLREA